MVDDRLCPSGRTPPPSIPDLLCIGTPPPKHTPCDTPRLHTQPQILELDAMTDRHWAIQGCSAVTGDGLLEGIDWVVDDIASRIYMYD